MAPSTVNKSNLLSGAFERIVPPPDVIIQCDDKLYGKIAGHVHNALVGKSVLAGDSLISLVERYCPEIYEICAVEGFRFVPNPESDFLERRPPQIYFNIVRPTWANN
jgi:hypothetical protein